MEKVIVAHFFDEKDVDKVVHTTELVVHSFDEYKRVIEQLDYLKASWYVKEVR